MYMYTYTNIYVYINICIYIHKYVCIYLYVYKYMYTCILEESVNLFWEGIIDGSVNSIEPPD
jgi:hypothetical protein